MKKLLLFASFSLLWMIVGCSQGETQYVNQVTVSISIDQIQANPSLLNEAKQQILPDSNYILEPTKVYYEEDDTAFEVLQKVCKEQKITLEYNEMMDGTAYIEGINNLYEFDAGAMSGWLFKVNGEMISVGADSYIVEADDELNWYYCVDYMKEFE